MTPELGHYITDTLLIILGWIIQRAAARIERHMTAIRQSLADHEGRLIWMESYNSATAPHWHSRATDKQPDDAPPQ